MKNKEKIQILEHRLNTHSELLERIISKLEFDNEPQLKQLDHTVFDGLDSKWKYAAVDANGEANLYTHHMTTDSVEFTYCDYMDFDYQTIGTDYDATDWQNSLIKRDDIAKELAEVDLSNELTGSELCKAMLARGDKYVLCYASDLSDKYAVENRGRINLMTHTDGDGIFSNRARWRNAVPINQRTGEPLTASDVGL